ncbi:NAD-dependent epimerase/dehydratase family protein [Methylocystis heyeri]|uniref:NAD-dependent epimerase/dehydratase family protein n=1 Tax=Methylocystis heyeri TaxID=391905 RepID=A0A6B8KIX9_9HYPH|nr:NAD-dependent epimerase/dehydratase family protein [Methylocystis heyeri]QGM46855.1 NAD-dependent epimerase/dehydratase family protein [Methylocystis heyeri]
MAGFQRILLTGGGGFVGSYLAPLLTQAYPDAQKAMLALGEDRVAAAPCGGWTLARGDLLDAPAIEAIVSALRPDLVVHLAGQASIGTALGAAEQTWRANLHGSFNLAAALARHTPETTLLFASSASVYGASLLDGPATENAPLRPLDAYGRSKVAAEGALADVLGPRSRLLIARPVNHSGPRQSEKFFVLSSFAAQIAAMESGRAPPLLHVGDLSKTRDFLDVRDVVSAYMAMIDNAAKMPERVNCFNVASGEPHPIGYFLDGLRRESHTAFETVVEAHLLRPSTIDIPVISCDATKLRKLTGWRQRHSVDDMLKSLLDYWRSVESARA